MSNVPLNPGDVFFKRGQLLLQEMLRVAQMPANEFLEAMEDDLLALIEGIYVMVSGIPKDHQTPEQQYYLDCAEKFFKICAEKAGIEIPA